MNIHDSYRPVEVLLKFLGMLPLFWGDNTLSKLNLCQKAINLTNLLFNYSIAVVISSLYNRASMSDTSDWTALLQNNFITQTAVTAFPLVSITLGHALSYEIKKILQDVQMVDCKLALMSSNGFNYHHHRNVTAAFSGFYIAFYTVMFLTSLAICEEPIKLDIILIGSARNAFCLIMTTAQVLIIIWMVTKRFNKLNDIFSLQLASFTNMLVVDVHLEMNTRAANVYQSFSTLELFLKSIGILPLYWTTRKSARRLTRSQKTSNWVHLALNFIISMLLIQSYKHVDYFSNGAVHLMLIDFLCQGVNHTFPILTLTLGHATACSMKQVLCELHSIDYKLRMITYSVFNYRKHKTCIVWIIVFYATFTSILIAINSSNRLFSIGTMLCILRVLLTLAAVSTHFICSILLVFWRFERLIMAFRMYFPTTPSCGGFLSTATNTETVICNEKEQLAVLKQIKILHDKLNDVVELVNYCFSVQITFCVGLCFVIGVVCSFGLFRAFIYRNELFYMGVLNFVWYMYYLFFVLFFIAVGSKITREGKRIGVLVHKAINCATSSTVINELNIFSQQLLHRSPVITCGLFVYDWTLLYTMIGATATYLIILIQFDVSFPNLVNVNGTQTGPTGV